MRLPQADAPSDLPVFHAVERSSGRPAGIQSQRASLPEDSQSGCELSCPIESDPTHKEQESELQSQFKQRVLPAPLQQREVRRLLWQEGGCASQGLLQGVCQGGGAPRCQHQWCRRLWAVGRIGWYRLANGYGQCRCSNYEAK